jgi:hypothetical protein
MGVKAGVLVAGDVAVITGVDDAVEVTLLLIALSFGGKLETS